MRDALRCATVLAETLNYHLAAKKLRMSQSQLSRKIQSLEKQLSVKLFDRDRKSVRVSADGRAVLRDADRLLKAEDRFLEQVSTVRSKRSKLIRVAVAAYVSQTWISGAVAALARNQPEIGIRIQEVEWWDLAAAAVGENYDLAIGEISEAEFLSEIAIEPFPERRGSIVVRASHPLTKPRQVTLEQISDFPAAGPRLPGRIAQVLPKSSKLGQVTEDRKYFVPTIECATPQSSIKVVSESNAICMILPQMCKAELQAGTLVELPLHPQWLHLKQGIMLRRGRPISAAAQIFIAAAKAAERKYFAE